MVIHLLSGFLGSGKTTAIGRGAETLMQRGLQIAVVTNDQGINLVDSQAFNKLGIAWRQVGNGCFCCNYDAFEEQIKQLSDANQPDIIFAESVGTCTDIVATVFKPLVALQNARVTLTTIVDARLLHMIAIQQLAVFEEDVRYIFFKQIEEAEIVVINKTDLLGDAELEEIRAYANRFANKKVIYQQTLAANGAEAWLQAIEWHANAGRKLVSLDIDYDRYAAGEAMLAYYDGIISVQSQHQDAPEIAYALWESIVGRVRALELPVGHLKCWLDDCVKISETSSGSNERAQIVSRKATSAVLLINARVQTTPSLLDKIIRNCIDAAKINTSCVISEEGTAVFSPGYPRPTHRVAEEMMTG